MFGLITKIVELFEHYAGLVPVEIFTFFGAFIEEVIAPVPSPVVMTLAGSVAAAQNHAVIFIFWLALVGAFGKTLGALLLYFVTDKFEDFFLARFGKFLGVAHTEVENIGKHFSGSKWDDVILLIIRSLPIVPSAPVSIVCGFIKFNFKSFVTWTFFGTVIRNLFFLYFGYLGISNFEAILEGVTNAETYVGIGIVVAIALFIGWIYLKRKKHADPVAWVKEKLRKL